MNEYYMLKNIHVKSGKRGPFSPILCDYFFIIEALGYILSSCRQLEP